MGPLATAMDGMNPHTDRTGLLEICDSCGNKAAIVSRLNWKALCYKCDPKFEEECEKLRQREILEDEELARAREHRNSAVRPVPTVDDRRRLSPLIQRFIRESERCIRS